MDPIIYLGVHQEAMMCVSLIQFFVCGFDHNGQFQTKIINGDVENSIMQNFRVSIIIFKLSETTTYCILNMKLHSFF